MTVDTVDTIYSEEQQVKDFVFDKNVAQVFPDMVKRSVPGYPTIVNTMGKIAANITSDGGLIYDLGTSLGAVAFSVERELLASGKTNTIHAVDCSDAMVDGLFAKCEEQSTKLVQPVRSDILEMALYPSSVVCMNLVLQFIPVERRLDLLTKIYQSLDLSGALLITEKFVETNEQNNSDLINLHHEFKASQGYSPVEIKQKAKAISKVMPIESISGRKKQLLGLGFSRVYVWYQCFNFYSMVAIK
jgi:tRNA (cmo5U34)-methyltransferase